jgi:hypothetical protein
MCLTEVDSCSDSLGTMLCCLPLQEYPMYAANSSGRYKGGRRGIVNMLRMTVCGVCNENGMEPTECMPCNKHDASGRRTHAGLLPSSAGALLRVYSTVQ